MAFKPARDPKDHSDLDPERKAWIDNATYEQLLKKWRHDPSSSPWFQPPLGEYFRDVMHEKRKALSSGQATQISKSVGW